MTNQPFGLDPEERSRFRDLIGGIAGERIVILSTHIVSDVETIAERVVMIAGGTIVADDAPATLAAQLNGHVWEALVAPDALAALRQRFSVTSAIRRRDGVLVRLYAHEAPNGFSSVTPTLEEAYLVTVRASRAA